MQAVEATVRVEQCQSAGRKRQTELSEIAADPGDDWANARHAEMDLLGKSLKRDPQCVASQLRCTPAGRTWLIKEWKLILVAVPENGKAQWTNVESNRALDLQGKSKFLRALVLDTQNPFPRPEITRAVILSEIAKLELEQIGADGKDSKLRAAHVEGYSLEGDAKLKLLRRYETSAVRQYEKSIKVLRSLQKVSRERATSTTTAAPRYEAKPNPAPQESRVAEPHAQAAAPRPPENHYHRRKLKKEARREAYVAGVVR